MTPQRPPHLVVCAGESSGDQLAAGMLYALAPHSLRVTGMGGPAMRAAGVRTLLDITELAVVGLWEALTRYPRLRRYLRQMQQHIRETRPQLVILVDYVEFNLRLGAYARSLGIPVLFYVSPQIWAWRPQRIHRIKRCVDAMAVLFPFEVALYEQHGIPVRYVGNPLVDRIQAPSHDLRSELRLPATQTLIGLLPGSRQGELRRHWPLLLATARRLLQRHPDLHFLVPMAPGLDKHHLQAIAPFPPELPLTILGGPGRSLQVMAQSTLVITKSGTATLETGLLATPMVVIYRMAPLSYALLSRLLRIQQVALVNIVAEEAIVPELLQHAATPEAISQIVDEWLEHPETLATIRAKLTQIRERLGPGGADQRVAAMVIEMLGR